MTLKTDPCNARVGLERNKGAGNPKTRQTFGLTSPSRMTKTAAKSKPKRQMPYHLQQHYREAARRRSSEARERTLKRWALIYLISALVIAAIIAA